MLIVHIALTPLAGAPIRIVEAINKHTDFKARLIDFDPYRYKQRTFPEDLIWEKDKEQCLQLISQADIIHFHHFMDIESENNPFNINFKKIAPKAKFIRHYHTNLKQFCKWNNINETSVLNDKYPKLIVPHCAERSILDACIVPNIIPIYDAILTPRTTNNSPLQIFYSASSGDSSMWQARWESKGVPEVCSKFENLSKKADFNFKLIQNTPYVECMKLKQESDIIIGDTTSGSYHLTDLEALSMGKPVFSYLDSRSQFVLQNLLQCDSLPFINTRLKT